MIEFQYKYDVDTDNWHSIAPQIQNPSVFQFEGYVIRIGGELIFDKPSKEFVEAYEKEQFWQHLRD